MLCLSGTLAPTSLRLRRFESDRDDDNASTHFEQSSGQSESAVSATYTTNATNADSD
jgi:hypothetical protein